MKHENTKIDYFLELKNQKDLYTAYMPFIKKGGLFIRTDTEYKLNDHITVSLKLLAEHESYLITGKVIWINPKGAQDGVPEGIGIQFINPESYMLNHKIENYLTGLVADNEPTFTM